MSLDKMDGEKENLMIRSLSDIHFLPSLLHNIKFHIFSFSRLWDDVSPKFYKGSLYILLRSYFRFFINNYNALNYNWFHSLEQ